MMPVQAASRPNGSPPPPPSRGVVWLWVAFPPSCGVVWFGVGSAWGGRPLPAPVEWCGFGFACGGSPLRVWVRKSRGFDAIWNPAGGGAGVGEPRTGIREPGSHIHIYIYTHTHIYIYIHTHTQISLSLSLSMEELLLSLSSVQGWMLIPSKACSGITKAITIKSRMKSLIIHQGSAWLYV